MVLYAPYLYSVSGDGRPPPDTGESVSHEIQQFLLFGIAGTLVRAMRMMCSEVFSK